jgi:hypothetical protein
VRTGTLTVAVAWMCVLPLVPLVWWSTPVGACVSVFLLLLLNPSGNAGIGAYRAAITPDDLQGRVGSAMSFVSFGVMPFAPLLGGLLLATVGGTGAVAALVAATALGALVPTTSRAIRSVPRPSEWGTGGDSETSEERAQAPELLEMHGGELAQHAVS